MLNRITPIALGVAMLAVASVQSYAFMAATDEIPSQAANGLVEMIEALEADLEGEEIKCEDMLAKLDSALEEIDSVLDTGVEDETSHLAARDALIAMRLGLPCLGQELAQGMDSQPGIVSQPIFDGGIADGGGYSSGGYSAGCTNCGGGGGGFSGGGGGGLLLLGGAAAAIAIPLAGSDDDAPAPPATVMMAN